MADADGTGGNVSTRKGERRKWSRWVLFGVPIIGGGIFFLFGILFWGGFNTAMEATNTLKFCISCHEMENTVYQEYKNTIHYHNRTGVRAICSDCHVPDPWVYKFLRKIAATKELWGKITGTISTKEKFEARRLQLAKHVWKTMKETDSRECRNCHNYISMAPEFQRPRARKQHLNAFKTGQTCIDCHKGIAHKNIRDQLDEEELEALEAPNPDFVRPVPEFYLASLKRIEEKEAREAAEAEARAQAASKAARQALEAAVEVARAEEREKAAAAIAAARGETEATDAPKTETPAAGGNVGSAIDWSTVEARTVTLFYPGQTSFEWVRTGRDHGGARAFLKGGDRCATCHLKEVKDMGAKLVSGEKAEETPIPGKRPFIDMRVQAAHDAENLYLRLQWDDTPHVPVPFIEGGKMDPANQIKVAMMIAGKDVEYADRAGCWVTCHHDSRYMPHAPKADALAAASDVAARIDISDGITKYLTESRTKVEVKGRRGKIRGGWQKLKDAGEIEALRDAGTLMDLLRFRSGEGPQNGFVLAERKMQGGAPVMGEGKLQAGQWTVILSRPLAAGDATDIALEAGKTYTVGFAIHDDFASARFHHVSLEYSFALDDPEAEINVKGK